MSRKRKSNPFVLTSLREESSAQGRVRKVEELLQQEVERLEDAERMQEVGEARC